MIPQSFIDDLIVRTDIVDIIQARMQIKKKGNNYLGLCPFHNEKTPSFTVNAQKQFYYCFGCGASGNAIGFLMSYDHMEFIDAITDLAAKLGVEIPNDTAKSQPLLQHSLDALHRASDFYQQQLRASPAAIGYLKARGLTGQIAKQFQLGFAPDEWDSLIRVLDAAHSLQDLESSGLIIRKDTGKCYDRFRNRIIFPIRNTRGQAIAFGGRTLGDELPKYINSPETVLFQKSHELYGLYEVLQHNHQPGSIIIVEGYLDVIALHQYGICNAVATLGTATNPKHLQKLFRYTNEIIFCFDGDKAGQSAAWKAVTINLSAIRDGVQIRFMFLPEKDDPDSLVRRIGEAGFQQRLKQAKPLSQVFFELIKQESALDTPDSKALYAKEATRYLNQMPKGIFRELMFEQLAKELHVYVSDLNALQVVSPARHTPLKQKALLNPAQKAIALLLQEPKLHEQCPSREMLVTVPLPEIPLLIELLDLLRQNPLVSIGELIAHFVEEHDRQMIASLAVRKLPLTMSGILAEFNGTIELLKKIQLQAVIDQLIAKSRSQELSSGEKKELTHLLTQLNKAPI